MQLVALATGFIVLATLGFAQRQKPIDQLERSIPGLRSRLHQGLVTDLNQTSGQQRFSHGEHIGPTSDVTDREHLTVNPSSMSANDDMTLSTQPHHNTDLPLCALPIPPECLPKDGCPSNLIDNHYWSFAKEQCQQIQILKSYVKRIGHDRLYSNVYDSRDACMSKCVPPSSDSVVSDKVVKVHVDLIPSLGICALPQPTDSIPPMVYHKRLVDNRFWTFRNGQCLRTLVLRSHIRFIRQDPYYRNFFISHGACMAQCGSAFQTRHSKSIIRQTGRSHIVGVIPLSRRFNRLAYSATQHPVRTGRSRNSFSFFGFDSQ